MKTAFLLSLLVLLLLGPIALRPQPEVKVKSAKMETLIIITPHNETIRAEMAKAFEAAHLAKMGTQVVIDWRTPGGTSEIARYLSGEYLSAFQNHWTSNLGLEWDATVAASFANAKIQLPEKSSADTPTQAARRAFLDSNAGCGIDLFFGGGSFDFGQQAAIGTLVSSGVGEEQPDLFNPNAIPQKLGGEALWDPKGRWVGVCLSSFGICYNTDSLARLRISEPPHHWTDLADPRYLHQVALANPTQSGSVNRAFELLIQQCMAASVSGASEAGMDHKEALEAGWKNAMQLIIKIAGNSRYFTDSASKVALDVASGEASAGMCIDFYGRVESESLRRPKGISRMQFAEAKGGTSFGADTLGMLKGAPHPDLAKEFIHWSLTPAAQKLWNWKVNTPGGPSHYALRRLPILPSLYGEEFRDFRADPEVLPYKLSASFTYRSDWTGSLFKSIGFIVRVMCIDPHSELTEAWAELITAGFPPKATAAFLDTSSVAYSKALSEIKPTLDGDKIAELRLAKTLADGFREQYQIAAKLARAKQ